jgi:hypothetical protein
MYSLTMRLLSSALFLTLRFLKSILSLLLRSCSLLYPHTLRFQFCSSCHIELCSIFPCDSCPLLYPSHLLPVLCSTYFLHFDYLSSALSLTLKFLPKLYPFTFTFLPCPSIWFLCSVISLTYPCPLLHPLTVYIHVLWSTPSLWFLPSALSLTLIFLSAALLTFTCLSYGL